MERLFYKYLVPLLAISIVPILVIGLLLFYLIRSNITVLENKLIEQNTEVLTREVSYKNEAIAKSEGLYIEQEIDRIGNKLSAMVLSVDFIRLEQGHFNAHVENLMVAEPAILEFGLLDQWGELQYSKLNSLTLITDEPAEFLEPGALNVLERKESFVSRVTISNKTQLPLVTLGQPILDFGGNFSGAVFVKLDLSFIWNIVASKSVGEEGLLFIISHEGVLISHPSKKELYQNTDYSKYDYVQQLLDSKNGSLENDNKLVSYYTNKYDWTTVIEIPMYQALTAVDENQRSITKFVSSTLKTIAYATVGIILLGLLISTFAAIFITRRIITPIVNFTNATKKITEGELSLKIEEKSDDEIGELTASFNEMTRELKRNRDELLKSNEYIKQQAEELLDRYNADLEQFAYITTHDLIKPLKRVDNYIQHLNKKYDKVFDDDARAAIGSMGEDVEQMHYIINDLFEYSHVRTSVKEFEEASLEEILAEVQKKMEVPLKDAGATLSWDPLPTLNVVRTHMVLLFQNLAQNIIKIKSSQPYEIHLSTNDEGAEWSFIFSDRRSDIDPIHYEQIFEVFSQLDNKDQYPGSGMDLAICKNIVEKHGGTLWAKGGEHFTFHFALRKH